MSDMLNEEDVGHLPSQSQSRHERMHEQYNSFLEDEEHWQDVRGNEGHFRHFKLLNTQCLLKLLYIYIYCRPVTGLGSVEESPSKCFTGADQERGRKEEDGEKDEGRGK